MIKQIAISGTTHDINLPVPRATTHIKTSIAKSLPTNTEAVYFCGSDGTASGIGFPETYCIAQIKKGDNRRTLIDCYGLVTQNHYTCGNIDTNNDDGWSAWTKQPNAADLTTINTAITNITNGTTKVGKAGTADSATSATSATKATQDASGNVITSTYETKSDATTKLNTAKSYADTAAANAAAAVKNDLLNGAGSAYDTLKELADLILADKSAIEALETVAANKVDKTTTVNGKPLSSNVTITKSDLSLGNVENKSSATIRGEITKANVTTALGFTPLTQAEVQAMINASITNAISASY